MADYNEMLAKLRNEVATAVTLGIVNTELYGQQMLQLLNAIHTQKTKAQSELERLQGQIGECKGRMTQCDLLAGLVVEIIAGYNRAEQRRLEEETRFAEERREKEEAVRQAREAEENAKRDAETSEPAPTAEPPKKKRR